MKKRKSKREHGKVKLSEYFQDFKEGDKVAIVREHSFNPSFPHQIQGRTGTITGKRGEAYIINMKDLNKEKTYIIHPVHLKRIKG